MNKVGQFISTVVIGGFAVIVIAMIFLASNRGPVQVQNSMTHVLDSLNKQGITATALSPADVYGEDWQSAYIACPGIKGEEIAAQLSNSADEIGLPTEVGEDENYLVVVNGAGEGHAEKFGRGKVDLCTQPIGGFNAYQLLPLIQDAEGVWTLAA